MNPTDKKKWNPIDTHLLLALSILCLLSDKITPTSEKNTFSKKTI